MTACTHSPSPPRPSEPTSPIGSHVRVAGGLATGGIRHADRAAAEVVQVFVSNPQGWATRPGDPKQDAEFRRHTREAEIPVFVHAPYLVNFGSPAEATVRRSRDSLAHSLRRGEEIGATGVVVHTGSAVADENRVTAMRQVRDNLLPLLETIPEGGPRMLLEPTAGQGRSLAATVDELGPYLANLDHHPRLGMCLDTCHLFAAGHDLTAPEGVDTMLDAFHGAVGRDRLQLVHANDSASGCGSRRDRHAAIGKGHIGEAPFRELLHHPVTVGVPFLVETPGTADDHHRDVDTLTRLRDDPSSSSG